MNTNIIIAFDGPDNVGKGTQINRLRKHFKQIPFFLSNLDRPAGSNNQEKLEYGIVATHNNLKATRLLMNQGIPHIIDRMHYTEYAYSILRDGHDIETILDIEKQYPELQDRLFTIIFIDEVENISRRDDGDSVYNADDLENIKNIINRFQEISIRSIFDNIVINIKGKSIDMVQQEVVTALENKFPELKKHH